MVPGKRTAANCRALVAEARRRTGGRVPRRVATDEYPAYKTAIDEAYGRRTVPLAVLPRPRGRVVRVTTPAVFGSAAAPAAAVGAAPAASTASTAVNTSFVERTSASSVEPQNGTDRHPNARHFDAAQGEARKT